MPPVIKGLTGNYLYFNFLHYLLSTGYVQEIKELLFAMTKEKDMSQLKAVYEKYSANVPESLSSQFPDRVTKPEAVQHHIERTQKETSKLYPSGILKYHEKDVLFQRVYMYIT